MIALLYALLRMRNDVNAVAKGKGLQRMGRRVSGRLSSKFMNGLF